MAESVVARTHTQRTLIPAGFKYAVPLNQKNTNNCDHTS